MVAKSANAGLPCQFFTVCTLEFPSTGHEIGARPLTPFMMFIRAVNPLSGIGRQVKPQFAEIQGEVEPSQRPSLGEGVSPQKKLVSSTISTPITRPVFLAQVNAYWIFATLWELLIES